MPKGKFRRTGKKPKGFKKGSDKGRTNADGTWRFECDSDLPPLKPRRTRRGKVKTDKDGNVIGGRRRGSY